MPTTIETEFRRQSEARYFDANGILRTAPNGFGGLRDNHRVTANDGETYRTTLLEASRENLLLHSEDADASFTTTTNLTKTLDTDLAPDGTVSMDTLDKTSAADTSKFVFVELQSTTDGDHVASIFVRQGSAAETALSVFDSTAGSHVHRILLTWDASGNPEIATVGGSTGAGTLFEPIDYGGGVWRIAWVAEDVIAANTTRFLIYPSGTTTATGTTIVWGWQVEKGVTPSSYIATGASAETRADDDIVFPFLADPQEMTVFCEFVESGSIDAGENTRVWHIGSGGVGTDPRLTMRVSGGEYGTAHDNGTGVTGANIATPPEFGDRVEFRTVLATDGSLVVGQSVNGASETTASGGSPTGDLASAWSGEEIHVNNSPGSNHGYNAFVRVIALRGEKTRAECRAAVETDADVLFWYEPGDPVVDLAPPTDVFVGARATLSDWTPGAVADLVELWETSGDQRSFRIRVGTDGALDFETSSDGASGTVETDDSSVAPTVSDGDRIWVGAFYDASEGLVSFWYAADSDFPLWRILGVAQAHTTDPFNADADVVISDDVDAVHIGSRAFDGDVLNWAADGDEIPPNPARAAVSYLLNPSALFAIDDAVVPVESLQSRLEGEGQIVRAARSGRLRTTVTSDNPFRRIWNLRTPILDIADIEELETTLAEPGPRTLNGVRIRTDGTKALVRGEPTRDEDNGFEARLTVELAQVDRGVS